MFETTVQFLFSQENKFKRKYEMFTIKTCLFVSQAFVQQSNTDLYYDYLFNTFKSCTLRRKEPFL